MSQLRDALQLVEGNSAPMINKTAFPDTPAEKFWSSTFQMGSFVYQVVFAGGSSQGGARTNMSHTRCVR